MVFFFFLVNNSVLNRTANKSILLDKLEYTKSKRRNLSLRMVFIELQILVYFSKQFLSLRHSFLNVLRATLRDNRLTDRR